MVARHEQEVQAGHPLARGRPRLVESKQGRALILFCSRRQVERKPATVEEAIDYMRGTGKEVERFWVKRYGERNTEKLTFHQVVFLDEDRYSVNRDDIKAYFDCCRTQLAAVPSPFVSIADETRVGAPKKQQPPSAIVPAQTGPGHITEKRAIQKSWIGSFLSPL
jgi:hypothetical protein